MPGLCSESVWIAIGNRRGRARPTRRCYAEGRQYRRGREARQQRLRCPLATRRSAFRLVGRHCAETLKASGKPDNTFTDLADLPNNMIEDAVATTLARAGKGTPVASGRSWPISSPSWTGSMATDTP